MTGPARLTPLAHADIAEASAWYAAKGNHVALAFQAAVDETLTAIASYPLHAPEMHPPARRRNLGKPRQYAVWYLVEDEGPLVFSGAHHRGSPKVIRARQRKLEP